MDPHLFPVTVEMFLNYIQDSLEYILLGSVSRVSVSVGVEWNRCLSYMFPGETVILILEPLHFQNH